MITPAFAHEPILKQIAPHLDHGAFVGAIPGPGAFDLLAIHALGSPFDTATIELNVLKVTCSARRILLFSLVPLCHGLVAS